MSRLPARYTQADIARALRAARQIGAAGVEIRSDGTIFVQLSGPFAGGKSLRGHQNDLENTDEIVL